MVLITYVTGGAAKSIQSINVAAAAAVAAVVAGLASPSATLKYEKTACVAQNSSFSLSFSYLEQPSLFSHVHARPELVQGQGWANKTFLKNKKIFFGGHFLVRQWGICSICFCILLCIYFQVLGSNFTKNPFCYFRISSLISHCPKNPIICQSVQKCLPNSSFLCKNFKKPAVFSIIYFFLRCGRVDRFGCATR